MALFEIAHFWSNLIAWGYQRNFQYDGATRWHGGTSAFLNIIVIAMVPPFRRGRHRRQSEAIVGEGMGPDD